MFRYITTIIISIFLILSSFFLSADGYNKSKAKKLYKDHCSKCHRTTGKGIKRVYPPLKNADYIQKATSEELLRGMLFGRSGRIVVNGETYNGVMTTEIDNSVSDDDIALILTYIYKEFNNIDKSVSAGEVVNARKKGKLPPHK